MTENNAPVELGKRKHQGAQTIVYFLVILAGTALKLENVGPTFPFFALDPSNRPRENKAIIVRTQLQREHILGFSKRK